MLTDSELEKYGVWIKSGPVNIELSQQTPREEAFVSQQDEFVQAMGERSHEVPPEPKQTSDHLSELAEQMQSEISALKEEIRQLKSKVMNDSYILEDNTAVLTDNADEYVPAEEEDDQEILELDTLEQDDDDIQDTLEMIPAEKEDKKKEDPESEDLKEEVRSVLAYLDQLLESLPDSKIQEFAQSKQFVTYRKLFQKLELI